MKRVYAREGRRSVFCPKCGKYMLLTRGYGSKVTPDDWSIGIMSRVCTNPECENYNKRIIKRPKEGRRQTP